MERGTVSWFDPIKGFGFIIPDIKHSNQKDIFVHKSNVETSDQMLDKGARVEFDLGTGPKGPEAKSVRLLEEEA